LYENLKKMFTYQKTSRYFAQIARGLEPLGCEELAELGAAEIKSAYRGIYFKADHETLYRVNYQSRLCTRILAPLLRFDCHSDKYLYKTALKIDWQKLLSPKNTFAVAATTANSNIKHSQYAGLRLKDAIADYFREKTGSRPSVDTKNPDVWINLRVDRNKATISLDTSGGSLHRRGYRLETVEAPMQETVAAAMIRFSKWNGRQSLVDPMCGSGTILCEALMHFCHIPASYLRSQFGFQMMPDFDAALWAQVKKKANTRIRRLPKGLISGSDIDSEAIAAAKTNCAMLPHGDRILLRTKRYQDIDQLVNTCIISNPPYGIRLGKQGNMTVFIKKLGDFLKKRCPGSSAFLYFGNTDLIKATGLKAAWKKPLMNGGLSGQLVKYMIRGTA
jgi:putative N6-adenine-specific DNA methylase